MKSIQSPLAATMLALGAAMALPLSASAAADPQSPPPHAGMQHHGPERLFEKLGLSADQKAKVDAIMQSQGEQLKKLHEQMRTGMDKLHALKPDDPNYRSTVAQVAQESGSLMTQAISAQGEMRAQMYAVLTPAQKKQLDQLEAKMREHMKAGGGRWGHHDPMMGPMGGEGPDAPPPPDAPAPPQ